MATILVIEDTQDNYDLVQDILGDTHELLHASNGFDGLHLALLHHPSLILLDMSLPQVDGWEIARALKADPRLAAIPVVAMTAHAMAGDRERCLNAGCDDYLSKPISIQSLTDMVERHLTTAASASGSSPGETA